MPGATTIPDIVMYRTFCHAIVNHLDATMVIDAAESLADIYSNQIPKVEFPSTSKQMKRVGTVATKKIDRPKFSY